MAEKLKGCMTAEFRGKQEWSNKFLQDAGISVRALEGRPIIPYATVKYRIDDENEKVTAEVVEGPFSAEDVARMPEAEIARWMTRGSMRVPRAAPLGQQDIDYDLIDALVEAPVDDATEET